ncbi:MAG: hypothetical protein NT007_00590 [Candidatus Kapabacteria bacterium]|nr:hypothetical protein [Candidatus Kapabacteria bacterium]
MVEAKDWNLKGAFVPLARNLLMLEEERMALFVDVAGKPSKKKKKNPPCPPFSKGGMK